MEKMGQIFIEALKKQGFTVLVLIAGIYFVNKQNGEFYTELRNCAEGQIELLKTTVRDNADIMKDVTIQLKRNNDILEANNKIVNK